MDTAKKKGKKIGRLYTFSDFVELPKPKHFTEYKFISTNPIYGRFWYDEAEPILKRIALHELAHVLAMLFIKERSQDVINFVTEKLNFPYDVKNYHRPRISKKNIQNDRKRL